MADKKGWKVYNIGTWKHSSVTDDILNHVSAQQTKRGKTYLSISRNGLLLSHPKNGLFSAKTDTFIPISQIYSIVVNRFYPKCLLCIVKHSRDEFHIIAYRCETELVAGRIIQDYRECKRPRDGEGFHMPLKPHDGRNWLLNSGIRQNGMIRGPVVTRQDIIPVAPQQQDSGNENFVRETITVRGKVVNHVGVQVSGFDHTDSSDRMSESSDMTFSSVRDDMEGIKQELRELKYLLQKSAGISSTEYFEEGKKIEKSSTPAFVSPIEQEKENTHDEVNGKIEHTPMYAEIKRKDADVTSPPAQKYSSEGATQKVIMNGRMARPTTTTLPGTVSVFSRGRRSYATQTFKYADQKPSSHQQETELRRIFTRDKPQDTTVVMRSKLTPNQRPQSANFPEKISSKQFQSEINEMNYTARPTAAVHPQVASKRVSDDDGTQSKVTFGKDRSILRKNIARQRPKSVLFDTSRSTTIERKIHEVYSPLKQTQPHVKMTNNRERALLPNYYHPQYAIRGQTVRHIKARQANEHGDAQAH